MGKPLTDGSVPVVTDVQAGDLAYLVRPSDGASGGKAILVEDYAAGLMALVSEVTVDKLTVTTELVPPIAELTFSGDVTLVASSDKTLLFLNTGGADRILTMPADAVQAWFFQHVGGGNTITIKSAGGATITTLAAGEGKSVVYSGTGWRVY